MVDAGVAAAPTAGAAAKATVEAAAYTGAAEVSAVIVVEPATAETTPSGKVAAVVSAAHTHQQHKQRQEK